MKLYYDMFVPFMPDVSPDDKGEFVKDDRKAAGRQAMIELSNFQMTGNLLSLYQCVILACKYANRDLVEVILNVDKDIEIQDGTKVSDIIDEAAKLLFSSINPDNEFDLETFTANILTAAHALFVSLQQANASAEAENAGTDKNEVIPEDKSSI